MSTRDRVEAEIEQVARDARELEGRFGLEEYEMSDDPAFMQEWRNRFDAGWEEVNYTHRGEG